MRGLKDKTFVIAGGATGIGAATAKRVAAEGGRVVVGDINITGASAAAEEISQSGGRAIAVEFDLSDARSVQGLVDRTIEEFGGIDGLHNVGADLSDDNLGRDTTILDTGMD
ncbi:MAG TPA: SDR family NAD(P)-dependent oxidoreductase, partial [Mycobacterium sp.]